MSNLSVYLGTVRQFIHRSPILFWSTLGLVAIVGVLFAALPPRVRDVREPWREQSDARKLADKPVASVVGEAAPVKPGDDRVATGQKPAARPGAPPSQSSAARGTLESVSAVSGPTTRGGFTVQVGSFVSEATARQMSLTLKASGYPAFIKAAQVPGKGRTYRVRVGMFASREEAKRYGDRLVKQETTVRSVLATIND